jgi:transposase
VGVFELVYDEFVLEGEGLVAGLDPGVCGFGGLCAVVKRLGEFRGAYLLFVRDPLVLFTNNLAERDLRSCKTRQKVSGCFVSWWGLVCFAVVSSFVSSEVVRGYDLLSAVLGLFVKPSTAEQ